ncbi:MAG: type I DNA topoisomerase [Candidatus Peregrinibacteria bacterium]
MPKHLVIVESPTKAKTIKRFLGKDYDVEASMGHIRDLPSATLAVDTKTFEASYEVSDDKKPVVKRLQKALDEAEELWIATDEDREGEAIGWHLLETLKRKKKQDVHRIVFHEITKDAIDEAVAHPRMIDQRLVDAQQARRVLDRLVGYTLSPFLWKKVYRGLSAGRVQSVAVRIIVDRERLIRAFKAEEYWTIQADLLNQAKAPFIANLKTKNGEKFVPVSEAEALQVVSDVKDAPFTVTAIDEKDITRTPPPPFTTSTLQQEAGRKLGFSVKQTMVVAQQLYEGVDLGRGEGQAGLITYMRTDSVNLSTKALTDARTEIERHYGREYIVSEPRLYKTKSKSAQEAHEAIRPSEISRTPQSLEDVLDHQQLKLYTLIWNRTVACQMATAELKRVGADITADKYTFRATGQTITFDGFLRVYTEGRDEPENRKEKEGEEEEDGSAILPPLHQGEELTCNDITPEQHFTKPPPRYTEASLVKKLEEEGIGRPSTYAPTISTIQQRGYIKKEGKQLAPEEIAFTVTDLLAEHFPDIVDLAFTATMEQSLDDIAEDKIKWTKFLKEFFVPFSKLVESKTSEVKKGDVMKERVIGIDPASGLEVLALTGRFGPYVQLGRFQKAAEGEKKKKSAKKDSKDKLRSASIPKTVSRDDITIEQALALLAFPRYLGDDAGEKIEVFLGRFGPYAKCGKRTASIPPDRDPSALTKDDVLKLFTEAAQKKTQAAEALRTLGADTATGAEVTVKSGRFGPYVTDGKTNASIPKRFTAEDITLEDASELLAKKRAAGPGKWKGKWKKKV